MKNEFAIRVNNLGKRYQLGASGHRSDMFRELVAGGIRSLMRKKADSCARRQDFWALRDATFEINRGENIGIIGLNGAGKSTLLKILSRITEPTTGRAQIVGRVGALLEVGTGFHGELTGRENSYLYGAILGMRKREIARKFDAIVEFAGIKDFIDTPVKRYSSGMYVRLAFAVAAHLEPEILLLDEVLSVGDLPFQRKCIEFARGLQRANATILFVSHNMFSIKTMCPRVIYLRQGQVQFDGPTEQGIKLYEEDCRLSTSRGLESGAAEWPIIITDVALLNENGHAKTVFDHGERIRLRLKYQTREPVDSPNFVVAFVRSDGVACCNYSTEVDGVSLGTLSGSGVIELLTPSLKLVSELYTIHVLIWGKGFQKLICSQIGRAFHIRHHLFDTHFGVFHESAEWGQEIDRSEQKEVQACDGEVSFGSPNRDGDPGARLRSSTEQIC
jgi:lipopolysaccharide transport system ATP-binding protein